MKEKNRGQNNGQNVAAATRGHDTAGRLGTLSTGDNEVRYRYDPVRGLRTGTGHYHKAQLALTKDRTFDAAGRIDFVQSRRRDNATILLRDYTLDDLGRRERADDEEGGHWAYGYNDRSEVVGGAKHRPNGDAIPAASFAYDFDGIGNRKTHTIGDLAPVSYTPNSLNQYAQVIGNEQAYIVGRTADGAAVSINGQPAAVEEDGFFSGLIDLNNGTGPSVTEVTIDADKAGKQTHETGALRSHPASATWQYDDDGNLLSDGLWNYTWNGENRLIAAETVATIPAAYRVKKQYVYDYRGRRVEERRMEFDETNSDYVLAQQLRWIYDDWNPVVEIANDQTSRHYVWGLDLSETPQGAGGVEGLLMSLDLTHASLSYSFIYDGNGNVLGLANLANGELIGRYEYSPFGKLLWKEGLAANINRWRFSTKLEDDLTGWLYYGFRYYDPEPGRWPSRDPIEQLRSIKSELLPDGPNLYGFIRNSQVQNFDNRGLYLQTSLPYAPGIGTTVIAATRVEQATRLRWLVRGLVKVGQELLRSSLAADTTMQTIFDVAMQRDRRKDCPCVTKSFYGPPDQLGRAQWVVASYAKSDHKEGERSSNTITPPGFEAGNVYHEGELDRGHLWGKQFGGKNNLGNIVSQHYVDNRQKYRDGIEAKLKRFTEGHQSICVVIFPIYRKYIDHEGKPQVALAPKYFSIHMATSKGGRQGQRFYNPLFRNKDLFGFREGGLFFGESDTVVPIN